MNSHSGIRCWSPATGFDMSPREERITPMNPRKIAIPLELHSTFQKIDLLDVLPGRYRGQSEQLNMYESGPEAITAVPAMHAPIVAEVERGCAGPAPQLTPPIV